VSGVAKSVTALRILYGLFFATTGLFIAAFVVFGLGSPPRQLNPQAQAFTDALTAARIIDPLLSISYLAGGITLLFRRTAPLGLILLTPPVVVIVVFHLVLDSLWFVALVIAAVHILLAWDSRARLSSLWTTAAPV
jgi:hypothetical protein